MPVLRPVGPVLSAQGKALGMVLECSPALKGPFTALYAVRFCYGCCLNGPFQGRIVGGQVPKASPTSPWAGGVSLSGSKTVGYVIFRIEKAQPLACAAGWHENRFIALGRNITAVATRRAEGDHRDGSQARANLLLNKRVSVIRLEPHVGQVRLFYLLCFTFKFSVGLHSGLAAQATARVPRSGRETRLSLVTAGSKFMLTVLAMLTAS